MKRLFSIRLLLVVFLFSSQTLDAQWTQTNGPVGGWIQSMATDGDSIWRCPVQTLIQTPSIPQGLIAEATNGSVQLRWNKNPESDILRYYIYGGTSIDPTVKMDSTAGGQSDTTMVVRGLTNGTVYYFRITAVDSVGLESGFSNQASAIPVGPPAAPRNLVAVGGDGQARLKWNQNTEGDFLRYRIYAGTSPNPTAKLDSSSESSSDTTKIFTGLANNTTYYYRVTAFNRPGFESVYSNQVTVRPNGPPAIPQNCTVTGGDGQATLRWNKNPDADLLRYRIYCGTSPAPAARIDSTTGGPADTARVITGLLNNRTYYFRITAVDSSGWESGYGSELNVRPNGPPAVPRNFSASAGDHEVTLRWVKNTELDILCYRIYGGTSSNPNIQIDSASGAADDTAKVITSLANNTVYYFRITAVDSTKWESPFSPTVSAEPNEAPAAPQQLTADAGDAQVALKWNQNTEADLLRYRIYGGTSAHPSVIIDSTTQGPADTAKVITGLTNNTTYYFRAAAIDKLGMESGFSNEASARPNGPPATPKNVTASAGYKQITLKWNKNNEVDFLKYRIYGSTKPNPTVILDSATGGPADTVKILKGLTNDTTYYFRISAVDSESVESNFSTEVNATPTMPALPSTFALSQTFVFPQKGKATNYTAADYQIIGIPGSSGMVVHSLFSGRQNFDWQVYWDDGSASDFLKVDESSSPFTFSTGKAYWALSQTDIAVEQSVNAPQLNSELETEIPVHSGWNLITDPFAVPVAWSKIQSVNGITSRIFAFSGGSFSESDSLRPYRGYYFFNGSPDAPLSVLRVPYRFTLEKPGVSPGSVNDGWLVQMTLRSGGITDCGASFGVSADSKADLDRADVRKPHAVGPVPGISFIRTGWDPDFPAFASDIRPSVGTVEKWPFTVNAGPGSESSLSFSGIENVPAGIDVYLIDRGGGTLIDLRNNSTVLFMPVTDQSEFLILAGSKDAILNEARSLLPQEFSLGQNYPNPFSAKGGSALGGNPSTHFKALVPSSANVLIAVFNVLGQKVRSICTGTLNAGQYEFAWDGMNGNHIPVPSGVYYCRMDVAGARSFVIKMVLVR